MKCIFLVLMSFFCSIGHAQNSNAIIDSLWQNSPSNDVVIFVNGFWGTQKYSPATCNKSAYWQLDSVHFKPKTKWNYNQFQSLLFFNEVFDYFKTKKIYFIDGGNFSPITNAQTRQRKGRKFAEKHLDSLIKHFDLDKNSKIHFITHSMGGAYAEGMITCFLKEKKLKIGQIIHLSTSEAGSIKIFSNEFGPEKRIQIISSGDKVVEQINRYHRFKKDNVSIPIAGCDYFACFYENEITRPQAGDIGHALHLRKFTFDVIRDLENLDVLYENEKNTIKNNSNYVPYRKVQKNGCVVEN